MNDSPSPPTEFSAAPTAAPEPTRTALPPGAPARIGDYEIEAEIGRGGMGIVYRAFDLKLGRSVALKMMQVGIDDWEDRHRFRAEAETLANLQHPHIVQVYHTDTHDGRPYLVMEYVEAGGLDRKLAGKPQSCDWSAELVEVLARAIQVAHDKSLIHRDLKPANVLLTRTGAPKITDFGLVKRLEAADGLTQTGALMGTPSYMAPEQAAGAKDLGAAVDIYALGAILYECLTGKPPFTGAGWMEVLTQVREADPAPPSKLVKKVPHDLSTICLKCLEKSPRRRYATATELADDLRNYLVGLPIKARSMHAAERLWRAMARRPLQAALAACSGLLLLALGILGVVLREHGRDAERRAERDEQRRAFDDEKRRQDETHQAQLRAQQEYFQAEYVSSLAALDGILGLTFDGDLKHLRGLGPLHKQLQTYYEALVERQSKTRFAEPEQLARVMKQLGAVLRERGEFKKAIDVLDKADQLCTKAAAANPASTSLRHYRAQVLLQRGRARQQFGAYAEAENDFRNGRRLVAELRAGAKGEPGYARTEGELLHWNASLLAEWGPKRWDDALALYDKAQALHDALARRPGASNEDRRNQARTYGYRGDLELDRGLLVAADSSYWRSHTIREKLAEAAGDEESRFQLARSWSNLGGYQTRTGALATARYFYAKSRVLREELVKQSPNLGEYLGDLGLVYRTLAELGLLTEGAGSAEGRAEDRPEALLAMSMKAYLELHRRDEKAVDPLSSLGACHALRARLRLFQGRPADARDEMRQAEDHLSRALQRRPVSSGDHFHLAAVRAMRAEAEGNKTLKAELEGEAFASLRRAYEDGFRRLRAPEVLADRAFASLKGRDDFKALVRTHGQKK